MYSNQKTVHAEWDTIPDEKGQKSPIPTATDSIKLRLRRKVIRQKSPEVYEKIPIQIINKSKYQSDFREINFNCDKRNGKTRKFNLKICSWKVNGMKGIMMNGGIEYLIKENADIILLQDTRCNKEEFPIEAKLPGYHHYFSISDVVAAEACSSMVLFTKVKPIQELLRQEVPGAGLITAEYSDFWLISVDAPDVGNSLVQQEKRLEWDRALKKYAGILDKKKPVIICGNFNAVYQSDDMACSDFSTNSTTLQRNSMKDLLAAGFHDTFRQLYPTATDGAYTYWSHGDNIRINDFGCRYDYFIVSRRISNCICDNVMRSTVHGSQHCPIILYAHLSDDMWIYVQHPDGSRIPLRVELSDSLEKIKLICQYLYGVHPKTLRFVFDGETMTSSATLSQHNVVNGDVIKLCIDEIS